MSRQSLAVRRGVAGDAVRWQADFYDGRMRSKKTPPPVTSPAAVSRRGRPVTHRPRVLLLIGSDTGFGRAILEGVIQYSQHHANWEFVHELSPKSHFELLRQYPQADGIIAEAHQPKMQATLSRSGIPAVLVTGMPHPIGLPLVTADNVAVGRRAFEYFHDLGFRNTGYYGYRGTWVSGIRESAFVAAAQAAGCACHVRHTMPGAKGLAARGREEAALAEWITGLPKPTAILVACDELGRIVASACRRAGAFVPEEVAILGVDNDQLECHLSMPALSSIDQGTHRIGYEAAALLSRQMAGCAAELKPVVIEPVGVVVRQSTNTLAIDHPEVVHALRFIRENAFEGIKIDDVLAAVPVSRRSLETHFKRILGRTIHQEILRTRIEKAKQLLLETDWAMPEVSVHCGFHYASHFSALFKRLTGLTPQEYRRRLRTG